MTQSNSIIYFKLLNSLKVFNLKKILSYKKIFKKKIKYFIIHGYKQTFEFKNKKIIYNLKKNLQIFTFRYLFTHLLKFINHIVFLNLKQFKCLLIFLIKDF